MGMNVTEVTDGIFRLSANAEPNSLLFEGIWPIPNGVSMNSYIVKGEKVAIVDGVCGWDGVPETLFEQFDQMGIKAEDIDYVIVNHHEPDHSGWLEDFKKIRDDFQIITSVKGEPLLEAFYEITNDVRTVKTGDSLDLGDGRVLAFADIPNVHWPETMATFDTKSGTLMPCDAFGSFGAISDAPYDDQLSREEIDFFEHEAVRYYSNIVAAFCLPVKKAIKAVEELPVKIIAPGHGIVWRKDPWKIVNDYKRYASYDKNPAKEEVTVLWGSMYGMTEKAVKPLVEAIEAEGVKVHVHRLPESPLGDVLTSAWTSTGIVMGMPTYEYKMFPPMFAALDELAKKKVKNRKAFRFGSYGWSGGAQKELDELMAKHKTGWDFLETVEFKGAPGKEDIELIRQRGTELAREVKRMVAEAPAIA
ncbi:FprA family A-type flavoprotein [Salinispira pacifica]|uniref:Flavoprotein n=1 Tax=Salinispira pacifica TaxID=1307761 RepID=V5WJ26_9SPIO|nr:FprA family A-type flavoprotein [Salinispira pacifica]AHC15793.1 Flavoprotein [Salinispira pacifica]